jgi:hypothetical protein
MANITIPGYDVVLENLAYCRRAAPLFDIVNNEIPINDLLRIRKMRFPTKDETLDHIMKESRDYVANGWNRDAEVGAVKRYLSQFREEDVINLIRRDIFLDELSANFSPHLQPGGTYLDARLATIPEYNLYEIEKHMGVLTPEQIECEMIHSSDLPWEFQLRIEDDSLPDFETILSYVEGHVRDSDVLSMKGSYKSYETAAKEMLNIYGAFQSPGLLDKLVDRSLLALQVRAYETVKNTIESMMIPVFIINAGQTPQAADAEQDEQVEPTAKKDYRIM